MKSFKHFVNEKEHNKELSKKNPYEGIVQGQLDKNGYPAVVIINDRNWGEDLQEFKFPKMDWLKSGGYVSPSDTDKFKSTTLTHWKKDFDAVPSISKFHHQVIEHLNNQQEKFDGDPLAEERHKSIRGYTQNSNWLNKTLYENHLNGNPNPEFILSGLQPPYQVYHHLPSLDHAVEHYKIGHEMNVYSGVPFHPDIVASKHPNRHIILPAYTSTSIEKGAAYSFSKKNARKISEDHGFDPTHKHIVRFNLKPGQKGNFAYKNSRYSGELEYVLPRNSKIQVAEKPQVFVDKEHGGSVSVWDAHMVH